MNEFSIGIIRAYGDTLLANLHIHTFLVAVDNLLEVAAVLSLRHVAISVIMATKHQLNTSFIYQWQEIPLQNTFHAKEVP